MFLMRSHLRDRRGVAALEFALILPLMIVLVFGVYELSEPMIIYQQVYSAAHSIPASASSVAVQGDGSTTLTYAQVQFEESTIFAEIPALRSGQQPPSKGDGVTISSVVFEPQPASCVPSDRTPCSFTANVVWSVPYTHGNSGKFLEESRPCGVIQQVLPGITTPGTLPTANVTAHATAWPDPILVADVFIEYRPLLLTFTTTPIEFSASGYWPVRSVKATAVDANGNATPLRPDQQYTSLQPNGTVQTCPAYQPNAPPGPGPGHPPGRGNGNG